MAYIDQRGRASPGGTAAVIAVHAAIGTALIVGMNVTGIVQLPDPPVTAIQHKLPPPPPETEPEPQPTASPEASQMTPPITVPQPPIDLVPTPPRVEVTDLIPPPRPVPQPRTLPGPAIDRVVPSPTPSVAPVGAKPRNNPGAWITAADYRSDWIRRELVGRASFRLEVAANGKVTGCRVTSSTGHAALDEATCRLVTRRARFEPARGPGGEPVAGSYSQSVLWQLPD